MSSSELDREIEVNLTEKQTASERDRLIDEVETLFLVFSALPIEDNLHREVDTGTVDEDGISFDVHIDCPLFTPDGKPETLILDVFCDGVRSERCVATAIWDGDVPEVTAIKGYLLDRSKKPFSSLPTVRLAMDGCLSELTATAGAKVDAFIDRFEDYAPGVH